MMPFYTFKCLSCNIEEEIQQRMNESAPICKRCANSSLGVHIPVMKRVWKKTGKPQFKGSGFYETDYKKKDKE